MKIHEIVISDWVARADAWLSERGMSRDDIKTGVDAWTVAHRVGLTSDGYGLAGVSDEHIQTALRRVFPLAVFRG